MADRTELIGTGSLAHMLGLSLSTVKRLDRAGVLPSSRRVANRRVWEAEQLPLIKERIEERRDGRRLKASGVAA